MSDASPKPPAVPPLLIEDGKEKVEVSGVAAYMIRMILADRDFFNRTYNKGVVHFHFSGKEQSANMQSELNCLPQGA